MIRQFGESTDANLAARLLKALLLDSDSIDAPPNFAESIRKSLGDGSTAADLQHFRWGILGLYAYRNGDAELAASRAAKAETLNPNGASRVLNQSVLALAHHQLGNADQARQAFATASQLIERMRNEARFQGHHDLQIAEILLREAAETINDQAN